MNPWIATATVIAFGYGTFRPDREMAHDQVNPNPQATITVGQTAVTTAGWIVPFQSQLTARGDG